MNQFTTKSESPIRDSPENGSLNRFSIHWIVNHAGPNSGKQSLNQTYFAFMRPRFDYDYTWLSEVSGILELGFCIADFWSSLAYESAEEKLKHCLSPGFLIPLVIRSCRLTRAPPWVASDNLYKLRGVCQRTKDLVRHNEISRLANAIREENRERIH